MAERWAIKLPLLRHEALLARRVLECSKNSLAADASISSGLTREAREFAAAEIGNILARLETLILEKLDG
jgi:hypothetical protein